MGDMVISYETLFELLRLERSRTELQQLPESYSEQVDSLFRQEQEALSLAPEPERLKRSTSLRNMLRIVHELYERREKKVLSMALDRSKTQGAVVDTKKLLSYELELFQGILSLLKQHRSRHLPLLGEGGKPPVLSPPSQPSLPPSAQSSVSPPSVSSSSPSSPPLPPPPDAKAERASSEDRGSGDSDGSAMQLVKFSSPFPSFLGPELEVLGPYAEEDVATLPADVAKLLAEKKRAQLIRYN